MPARRTPVTLQSDSLLALHAHNPERYPVLLESLAHSAQSGCFDILMAFPGDRLAHYGRQGRFLDELDDWWRREQIVADRDADLPFQGGWFLFLGYELAGQVEQSLRLPVDRQRSIAQAIRIPAAVIRRHSDGAAWIVTEDSFAHLSSTIAGDLQQLSIPAPLMPRSVLAEALREEPPERYLQAVKLALDHIAAGDIYQANLSRTWNTRLLPEIQAHELYRRLRSANPAPFGGIAILDDRIVVSSSPERLISVRNGIASTRPIAGTRARLTDHSDDAARLSELLSHPKERAEHVMLIDLERNDLGRVCEAGTVHVDEFMTLESYAHVHHIVSNVTGRLRRDVSPGQAIAAVFPGGTITGCPKVRCMQIIADLERQPRGAYTGSMGYLNRDGSLDLNILIRTLEIQDRQVTLRAGAGIVSDSDPTRELDETRAKARGLIRALDESLDA